MHSPKRRAVRWVFASVAAFLWIALPGAWAVEREDDESVESQPEVSATSGSLQEKVGFESESKLKTDPSGKSFFFLNNGVQWPEKVELVPPPKPPAPPAPKRPVGTKASVEASVDEDDDGETPKVSGDTSSSGRPAAAKAASKAASGKTAETKEPKKPKAPKKPAVSLPDIEQLLNDVRRSAQPKLPSDARPAPKRPSPASVVPSSEVDEDVPGAVRSNPEPPAGTTDASQAYNEVEAPVDMDALVHDLEKLQRPQTPSVAKKSSSTSSESGSDEIPWWWSVAAVTVGAVGLGFLYPMWRKRRRPAGIRPSENVDAETQKFIRQAQDELKRRRAQQKAFEREDIVSPPAPSRPSAARPARPQPAPVYEEPTPVYEPSSPVITDSEVDETASQVYLLPPELAEEERYKDVVEMASKGEGPRSIADKLNLGEGEVRLVMDIARLSRGRVSPA